MTKTFSTRALANELGCDPRRLDRALISTEPDARTAAGGKRWSLESATRALRAHGHFGTGSSPARTNGSDGSSRNGNGSDHVLDDLEQVSAELRDALAALRTVKGVAQRRTRATHIGPLLTRLQEALDRSAELLPGDLRAVTAPARREILGQFVGEIGETLYFDFSQMV
jgi:hypothetical protein